MAAPTINHTNRSITVSTSGTSFAEIAAAVAANTASGSVSGKMIALNYHLIVPNNTTLTSEDRVHWLFDGSAHLYVFPNGTVNWSSDNIIRFAGNAKGHSKINGTNYFTRLKFIIETSSGRNDFSNNSTAWIGQDLEFIASHEGHTFIHLENIEKSGTQLGPSNFQGLTKIINAKPSGDFFVQFDSEADGPKVYSGFDLSQSTHSTSKLLLYAPRTHSHACIMRGFRFPNSRLNVLSGSSKGSTANAYIDNPTFVGATNNLASIIRSYGGNITFVAERFSFWPQTLFAIANTPQIRMRVSTSNGVEVFNDNINASNLSPYTPAGEDTVRFVLWVETRRSTGAVVSTRLSHNIRARRRDLVEINLTDITLNEPRVYNSAPTTNPLYGASINDFVAVTNLDTAQKLYDYSRWYLEQNLEVDDFLHITRNTITSSYSFVIDKTASSVFSIVGNTITVRADQFSGNFELSGSATATTVNQAQINGQIVDTNGDSNLVFEDIDSWQVFSHNDRTAAQSLGQGSNGSFRFTFLSGTIYYLTLVKSGETLLKSVTPTSSGTFTVSLSTNAQLSAVISQLSTVAAATDVTTARDTIIAALPAPAPSATATAAAVWQAQVDDASNETASQALRKTQNQASLAASLSAAAL